VLKDVLLMICTYYSKLHECGSLEVGYVGSWLWYRIETDMEALAIGGEATFNELPVLCHLFNASPEFGLLSYV
jgi:hypothetical protein